MDQNAHRYNLVDFEQSFQKYLPTDLTQIFKSTHSVVQFWTNSGERLCATLILGSYKLQKCCLPTKPWNVSNAISFWVIARNAAVRPVGLPDCCVVELCVCVQESVCARAVFSLCSCCHYQKNSYQQCFFSSCHARCFCRFLKQIKGMGKQCCNASP